MAFTMTETQTVPVEPTMNMTLQVRPPVQPRGSANAATSRTSLRFQNLRLDPSRALEPARKKLTTVEAQRVMSVFEETIRRVEIVTLLPYIIQNIDRFRVSLGGELVELLKHHSVILSSYEEIRSELDRQLGRRATEEAEELSHSASDSGEKETRSGDAMLVLPAVKMDEKESETLSKSNPSSSSSLSRGSSGSLDYDYISSSSSSSIVISLKSNMQSLLSQLSLMNKPSLKEHKISISKTPKISICKSPERTSGISPEVSSGKSPKLLIAKSPKLSHAKSPRVSHAKSPRVSRARSPKKSHQRYSEVSSGKSPKLSIAKSPKVSRAKSPKVSTERKPETSSSKQPKMSAGQQFDVDEEGKDEVDEEPLETQEQQQSESRDGDILQQEQDIEEGDDDDSTASLKGSITEERISDDLMQATMRNLSLVAQQMSHSTKNILRAFAVNPAVMTLILSEVGKRKSASKNLISYLNELREILMGKLLTTPEEERERMAYLTEISKRERHNAVIIEKLEADLKEKNDDKDEEIRKKNEVIKRLQAELHQIEKFSEEHIRRVRADAEKQEAADEKNSDGNRQKLQTEVGQLRSQLQNAIMEHRETEQELRRKKFKVETEVENWIQRYDQELGERQDEYEEIDEIYTEEKKQLHELEERFRTLEAEYVSIMEERRLAREKREKAERELAMMVKAATTIQAFWRSYKVRKALKTRKKKKGGKKGTPRPKPN